MLRVQGVCSRAGGSDGPSVLGLNGVGRMLSLKMGALTEASIERPLLDAMIRNTVLWRDITRNPDLGVQSSSPLLKLWRHFTSKPSKLSQCSPASCEIVF